MALYSKLYFTTASLECFSTVFKVDVCYSGEIDIYIHKCLLYTAGYSHMFMFQVFFYVMTGPHVKQPVTDELSCIIMFENTLI